MPNLTKLTFATTLLILTGSLAAHAQDNAPVVEPDTKAVDIFASADIDADGALDRDEFVSFVVMKSEDGKAEYSAIKLSGAYDDHFNVKDYNADGLLTEEELLSSTVPETAESLDTDLTDLETEEPG
ncbi:CREC-EF hand family protein [Hellea balneolensis]|uniref:hypothetical protein n=1 Tax=Hellea balneolensis TaxID=287478 RepID=UPI000416E144|nr:hypothetical protein [Hellea balneolensis]